MEALVSVDTLFKLKLKGHDLVLAKATHSTKLSVTADVGRVYRFQHLFKDHDMAAKNRRIVFKGAGGPWDYPANFVGEVGFLFLSNQARPIYRKHTLPSTFERGWKFFSTSGTATYRSSIRTTGCGVCSTKCNCGTGLICRPNW